MHPRNRSLLAAAALLSAVACSDTTGPVVPSAETPAPTGPLSQVIASFDCTATRSQGDVTCVPSPVTGPAGPRRTLLGQNQVKLRSSNVVYDSATAIFAFDVTVQNLLAVPIGTPDGTTLEGMKVYYETGPTVTAYVSPGDTGTVTVANADGYANFTRAHQPYHTHCIKFIPSA